MQDPATAIRTAYAALLADVVHDGNPVGFYDSMAPDGAVAPYVIVAGQQTQSDNTKTSFGGVHTVTLSVVSENTGQKRGKKTSESIENQILARLMPQPGIVGLPALSGFHVYQIILESAQDLPVTTPTGSVNQRIIIIRHLVQQL